MERNDAQQEFVTFSDKQVMMSEKLTLRVVVSSRNFTSCSGHHLVGIFSCSVQEEGFVWNVNSPLILGKSQCCFDGHWFQIIGQVCSDRCLVQPLRITALSFRQIAHVGRLVKSGLTFSWMIAKKCFNHSWRKSWSSQVCRKIRSFVFDRDSVDIWDGPAPLFQGILGFCSVLVSGIKVREQWNILRRQQACRRVPLKVATCPVACPDADWWFVLLTRVIFGKGTNSSFGRTFYRTKTIRLREWHSIGSCTMLPRAAPGWTKPFALQTIWVELAILFVFVTLFHSPQYLLGSNALQLVHFFDDEIFLLFPHSSRKNSETKSGITQITGMGWNGWDQFCAENYMWTVQGRPITRRLPGTLPVAPQFGQVQWFVTSGVSFVDFCSCSYQGLQTKQMTFAGSSMHGSHTVFVRSAEE